MAVHPMPSPALVFKTADLTAEFEAIHQLNHRTFTSEIPQHQPNPKPDITYGNGN